MTEEINKVNEETNDNNDIYVDLDDFEFIDSFKEFLCLFNNGISKYKNRNCRTKALQDLAKKLYSC